MSDQRVTIEEGDLIIQVMQDMLKVEHQNPGSIYQAFQNWCRDNKKSVDLSHQSVRNWCTAAEEEYTGLDSIRPKKKAANFYAYVLHKKQQLHPDDWEGMFVRATSKLFGSSTDASTMAQLKRLHGTYAIIRRRWRRRDSDDQFIRCIVDFTPKVDRLIYRETARLGSPNGDSKDVLKEDYDGFGFLFGSSVWILAHEKNQESVRMMTIHHCEPPLLVGTSPIFSCRGTLIAVAAPGPNVSHRFVLRRIKSSDQKCSYINIYDLRKFVDEQEYNFLCYDNDKDKKTNSSN